MGVRQAIPFNLLDKWDKGHARQVPKYYCSGAASPLPSTSATADSTTWAAPCRSN